MPGLTYVVGRHAEGGWSINVNGVCMRYPTKDGAVSSAILATQIERPNGDVGIVAIQDDGSLSPHFASLAVR